MIGVSLPAGGRGRRPLVRARLYEYDRTVAALCQASVRMYPSVAETLIVTERYKAVLQTRRHRPRLGAERLAMTRTPHVLIVDDHREIRDALKRYLERNGFRADAAENASAMDRALAEGDYDLIVLDVMMPGEDGLSACRRLRVDTDIPVLMLTALGEETDRIVGLELGADDYIGKPFNPREVLARIKAILRRTDRPERIGGRFGGRHLRFDRWTLDVDRRRLLDACGGETTLTITEFRLLTALLERPRLLLSRDRLLDLTSGRDAGPFDRAIDNQISRLRRKIERDPGQPEIIATVRGGGYCLTADVTEVA